MNNQKRIAAIHDAGGRLKAGTNGNVWEWGPQMVREDALMDMGDDEFEALMEHYSDIARYESMIATLHRRVDKLECDLQDLEESQPTDEEREVLDALEVSYGGNANHYIDCLRPALAYASEHYGYSSPEYTAIDTIINYIAK